MTVSVGGREWMNGSSVPGLGRRERCFCAEAETLEFAAYLS